MPALHPSNDYPEKFAKNLAATIVWAQIFAIYCLILKYFRPSTDMNISWADPFIKILPIEYSVWFTLVTSIALAAIAWVYLKTDGLIRNTPFFQFASGVITAIVIALVVRLLIGDTLPDFVPAEESSKPGFVFGMAAGYGEEVLFRMLLTPLFFFGALALLRGQNYAVRVVLSATLAILLTAVAFVVLHELGEADGQLIWKLVATRFMIPGVIMGLLCFLIGPGFTIFMHGTMHVMIPLLFN
jgi:hypothetical protein